MDEDEFEDYFIIERDSGEPSSEGRLTHPAELREISPELEEQMKSLLKEIRKQNPELIPDKRKREEIYDAVIAKALAAKISQYPTTVEEDEALLQKEDLPKRRRMAIEIRLGEKHLLQEAVTLISKREEETLESNGERVAKKGKH